MIRSYPKIKSVGHKLNEGLFDGPVLIEEKIDGSQFSFGVYSGELKCKSKNRMIDIDAPDKMFEKAIESVLKIKHLLIEGITYRCEYLRKPKHNTLCYSRVPKNNLIIYDIDMDEEKYVSYKVKKLVSKELGLEVVPVLFRGVIRDGDKNSFNNFLSLESILGGVRIEGIVIKNYNMFGRDGKILIGKYVSKIFRERNAQNWKKNNSKDIKQRIGETLTTEARWNKAIQHLRDEGKLTNTPKDIGPLLKEIHQDVLKEEKNYIKEELFNWAWKDIARMIIKGFPEYYKKQIKNPPKEGFNQV